MAKRNLIFLDFDGVLNSERSVIAYNCVGDHKRKAYEGEGLDEIAVRLVRRLSEEAPAEIVISSSWRHFFPIEQIGKFLAAKGWPNAPIIGETPKGEYGGSGYGSMSPTFRGNEVGSFLARFVTDGNELGNWVCLDDSKDFHVNETAIGGFFSKQPVVFTNEVLGFQLHNFYDALKILNPEHKLLQQLEFYII